MNILYIVGTFSVIEPLGVLQISAITNQAGHKSFVSSVDDPNILNLIQTNKIDCVAYSFMSTEAGSFFQLTSEIKKYFPTIKIIAGGPHPTYYPQIADKWDIDAVIRGEGDLVINDLLWALKNNLPVDQIPNIHTKTIKNDQGPLVEDLDTLPFSDRELVSNIVPLKYIRMKSFFGTRGCPYKCSYCFNSAFNRMHKGKGEIIRRRSVENIVSEIEQVKHQFPMDFVRFGDDTFVMKLDQWVEDFAREYRKRVNLPFYFLIHPNLVDEDLVKVLKYAGCHSIMMGIESGSERLRKNILDRYVANETIVHAFDVFRKYNIKVFSNTILGLPDSSLDNDLESLEFTLKCRPTYSGFTVFTPFPGTELHRYSREKGYLKSTDDFANTFPASMQQGSILNHITKKQKDIHSNILVLAPIANFLPWTKDVICKHLIYWKPNFIFSFLGFLVRNYLNMKIWPFGKNMFTFVSILKKVILIDLKNYSRGKKDQLHLKPITNEDPLKNPDSSDKKEEVTIGS